ncbi:MULTISPECIES: TetR/AcrR family transcriptional regulator [Edaphosphingomonas]|uniref:TetR/AcrR family transcriptional regulator n=2 Tax=Edaphosphingomonas TaxID=3423724 RepID=A0A2T4HWP7_9SPHN|nr:MULTISPECIES: TetR/AcrR family transcriptional regulator [Sphingomonas]MDX3884604.1 TetR/AcrR family transcriptional regulator [Sphingomonas sp.]OHT19243.1 HTH-type transcriptional repressor NicS [Sphingomonas haloaromaticamans]PTD20248.1 TetR/AcrR family transcriptional regulator [Sphingomonas fennica]
MKSIREPVRQARGDATRQSILDAAEVVFAEQGYAAARLEDVALAVGIRRPSIVYHFPGKQELYDAVEADIFASMHAYVVAHTAGVTDPMARLLALLDAWLDFMVARPTAARIIQRLIADVGPRAGNPIEFSETALRDIEAIVAAGVEAGHFRPVPAMMILNGVAAGAIFYVCNARLLGEGRTYDPADPAELARFRALIHTLARAAVTSGAG